MAQRSIQAAAVALLIACSAVPAGAQFSKLDWKLTTVGKIRQVLTNQGTLNKADTKYPGLLSCEFPAGSGEEHLYQGGIWVGGILPSGDTAVSETQKHFGFNEYYPSAANWDTIWTGSKGDTLHIPYWPNYVALSDQDFVCRYNDYDVQNIPDHVPMGLEIVQSTYSWGSGQLDEFLLHTYYIIARTMPLKNVYVGFWMHGQVGTINCGDAFIDEYALYNPDYHMMIDQDSPTGCDGQAYSPIGFSVMYPTDPALKWAFQYYEHETLPQRDVTEYQAMSDGVVMPDRTDPSRDHMILSFGPYQLKVGDTIKVQMAEVLGNGLPGIMKNIAYLQFLKSKNFRVPSPPPRAVLNATTNNHEIHLDWHPTVGTDNPEVYTDPYRGDTIAHPFEGYRLYKSTKSSEGPWSLLADFDVVDSYGPNTGLQYDYVDKGLLNNIEYYYTITTYSLPDAVINFPSQESSLSANVHTIVPGTAPPGTVGDVAVVPNPYRGDVAYNSYNPPWEKPSGNRPWWMEQDRRLQFINLPKSCEIKIFSLAGDLVNTIRHEDPSKGYEDWNLTSHVGQAISSGIYLFTCVDLTNGKVQVGKFVVIK